MTRLVGVIGHPVGHSISPRFQGAALAAAGIDARYEAWDAPEEELPARLESLREPNCLGANVTIPHKQAVMPFLDELSATAAQVGAVNTIVNDGGRLVGHNTDGHGFVEALRLDASFEPLGRSILLLGAGGAARAIAFALVEAGIAHLAIHNRTAQRARDLVADISSPSVGATPDSDDVSAFDCVVNTTSVGMEGTGTEDDSPSELRDARPGTLVVDIVYNPAETTLLRIARESGLPTLNGVAMLVRQGARSFELWTGRDAPVDVMFRAAREALSGAGS